MEQVSDGVYHLICDDIQDPSQKVSDLWTVDRKTIERKIKVEISLGHKKMKFRHNEPITRVNYLKSVSLEQKTIFDNKDSFMDKVIDKLDFSQKGRWFEFNWSFPQDGS